MKQALKALARPSVFFLAVWVLVDVGGPRVLRSEEENQATAAKKEPATGVEVIKRGAAIGDSPVVPLDSVFGRPEKYVEKTVIFDGTVAEVCQKKGCWMEVVSGDAATRVRFKDYGFFVPMDCQGMWVRAEGVFVTKVWSKEDVDHLVAEGANLTLNEDGTATELSFVATGVVLKVASPSPSAEAAPAEIGNENSD